MKLVRIKMTSCRRFPAPHVLVCRWSVTSRLFHFFSFWPAEAVVEKEQSLHSSRLTTAIEHFVSAKPMMRQSPVNTKRINTVGFQVLKADARSRTFLSCRPLAQRPFLSRRRVRTSLTLPASSRGASGWVNKTERTSLPLSVFCQIAVWMGGEISPTSLLKCLKAFELSILVVETMDACDKTMFVLFSPFRT